MTVVITGCGHSGTTYIARLLTHAGLRCRHEHVFGLGASEFEFEGAAEESWLAVPRLGELRTRQRRLGFCGGTRGEVWRRRSR